MEEITASAESSQLYNVNEKLQSYKDTATMLLWTSFRLTIFLCALYLSGCAVLSCPNEIFVIAIDIGHGEVGAGGISARGVSEFEFNHRLAVELLEALRNKGYKQAFLINESGTLHGSNGLKERTRIANTSKVDLFISIHHDSVQEQYLKEWLFDGKTNRYSNEFSGYSIIYSKNNKDALQSFEFAQILGDELIDNDLHPSLHHAEDIPGERRNLVDVNRGIYDIDFWVVKESLMPSVLFEAGIIVNREEELMLATKQHRKRIVESIVGAVSKFCKSVK